MSGQGHIIQCNVSRSITYKFFWISGKFIRKRNIDKYSSRLRILRESPTAPFSKSTFLGLWWRRAIDTRDLLASRDSLLKRRNTIRRLEKARQSAAARAARLRLVRGSRLSGAWANIGTLAAPVHDSDGVNSLSTAMGGLSIYVII